LQEQEVVQEPERAELLRERLLLHHGLSSGSKKSTQSDSDSESDDEVRDELPFLRQENERLGSLLDNCDDML
jgi:hypothetical protein